MIARRFACHLMDAAAGAMGIARGDALFALAALLWYRHQLSWPLAGKSILYTQHVLSLFGLSAATTRRVYAVPN